MKRILSVVLLLVLCLSLFACGKQPVDPPVQPTEPAPQSPTAAPTDPATEPPTEAPPEPDAPVVPEVIFGNYSATFVDSSGAITYVRADANLPHVESLPQIHTYYQTLWEDVKATYELSREDAIRHKADLESMGQEFIPWAVEITFYVARNDGKTLSVLREVYENLGGAHPLFTYRAETFDVASQGRLALGDLFQSGADYQSRLTGVDEADQLNFALTDDNLVLCTETGTVSIPLSDLSDILKPQYLAE